MKFFYFITALFISFQVTAQSFYDLAPCNNNPIPSSYSFDWKAQTFTYYGNNDLNPRYIPSPFYQTSLSNLNVNEFSYYADKDFHEADGWHLITKDFGSPGRGVSAPYFVLYNRFTGTLRVFVALTRLIGQNNAATITLSYANKLRTAHLESYNPNDVFNSLEDYNNNIAPVQVTNYFVNQENYWFHADFNMNYDPCACNYENSLNFSVSLSQTSTLNFQVNGQALQNYNLNEFTDNFGRVGQKGNHSSSKGLSNFPPFTTFKNILSGLSYAQIIYENQWVNNTPQRHKDELMSFFLGMTNLAKSANAVQSLVGLVFGNSVENRPQVPLALDIKLKGTGTVSADFPYTSTDVVSSNSYQTGITSTYLPEYNKGYGIFTLLTTPTLTATEAMYDEYDPYDYYQIDPVLTRRTSKFKLNNPIKYIVNPNAGFDLAASDLKASLVFKGTFGDGYNSGVERTYETQIYPIGCLTELEVPFDETRDWRQSPTYVEGWTPTEVYVKIYAKLHVPNSNKDVYYVNTFKAKADGYVYDAAYSNMPFPEVLPTGCTFVNPPATDAEIRSVCNSTKYKDKAKQYYTQTTDGSEEQGEGVTHKANVIIRSNPIQNNKVSLSIYDTQSIAYHIEFFDVSGRLIKKVKTQSAASGVTNVDIDLGNIYSHGLGLLKVSDGGRVQTFKILY